MYGVVLLIALSASEESAGRGHIGRPTPMYGAPGMGHYGYDGGYHWPGYACWGGCGGYASPAYGFPMTPLVNPPAVLPPEDPNQDKETDPDKGKKSKSGKPKTFEDDDEDGPKMKKPKSPENEIKNQASARVTILLPAGAKLYIDGKSIENAAKTYRTPALEAGYTYYYEMKAEMRRDGKMVSETRRIKLTAGSDIRADFRDLDEGVMASAK